MRTLEEQLGNYAAYHRDRRNIATHFVGIPMIFVAIVTLLSRPGFEVAGVALSPAVFVAIAAVAYYLRLDLRYGVTMAVLTVLSLWAGAGFAAMSTGAWLGAGLGLFVVGWAIQFLGHAFEGKKPAFLDDLMGLLIGPLFVVAEAGFALGARRPVHDAVIRRAGPTRSGRVTAV